jgi:hypothetical protein
MNKPYALMTPILRKNILQKMHQENVDVSLLRDIIKELTTTIRKQDFLTYFKKISLLEQTSEKITF